MQKVSEGPVNQLHEERLVIHVLGLSLELISIFPLVCITTEHSNQLPIATETCRFLDTHFAGIIHHFIPFKSYTAFFGP
jgi:hypothetical protein